MDSNQSELIDMKSVVDRLKKAIGTSLDQDLAKVMDVHSRNLAQWKARNSVPAEKITKLCIERDLDIQYILTGKNSKTTNPPKNSSANYSAFPELDLIFKETTSLWKRLDTTTRFKMASKLSKELQLMKDSTKKPKN